MIDPIIKNGLLDTRSSYRTIRAYSVMCDWCGRLILGGLHAARRSKTYCDRKHAAQGVRDAARIAREAKGKKCVRCQTGFAQTGRNARRWSKQRHCSRRCWALDSRRVFDVFGVGMFATEIAEMLGVHLSTVHRMFRVQFRVRRMFR